MKILFLTDRLPYPFTSGASVRTFNVMQSLSLEHEISLLSMISTQQASAHKDLIPAALSKICRSIDLVPHTRQDPQRSAGQYLKNVLQKEPWMVLEYHQPPFLGKLQELLNSGRFDLVQAELLSMTQYLPFDRRVRKVYGAHNVESSLLWQRLWHHHSALVKFRCFKEYLRVRRYERLIMRKVQLTIAVTREDQIRMHGLAPFARIGYFPITIDTDLWQPSRTEYEDPTIVFIGTLYWYPNVDGLLWFSKKMFPRILKELPRTRLVIVGRDPIPEVARLAEHSNITLNASVPEISPFLKRNALFIVPLRMGGGMRVKILEALAREMPIVSTAIGCEGIEVLDRQHLYVENSVESFARACMTLLKNSDEQRKIGQAGRRLVEQNYHWTQLTGRLSALYNLIEEL